MRWLGKIKRAVKGWWLDHAQSVPPIPDNVTKQVLGKSVQGREIVGYEMGEGHKLVVVFAAIHGNEVGTTKLARCLLAHLAESSDDFRARVLIVPVLNPDGYAEAKVHLDYWNGGRIGRFNAHGVDLNRSFDTPSFVSSAKWVHGKAYQDSTDVFGGDQPGSEPEVQAFMKVVAADDVAGCIMLHSAGSDIVINQIDPAPAVATEFSNLTGFRIVSRKEWESFSQTGSMMEWTEINQIPYLEIECSSRWDSDWPRQKPALLSALKSFANHT